MSIEDNVGNNVVLSREVNEVDRNVDERLTRKRYMELFVIAEEVVNLMESRGVKRFEGCFVRKFAEELWLLKKE